ncbi:MAG: hypothetical protein ACYSW4_00015 [Planctomycetota bacterium]
MSASNKYGHKIITTLYMVVFFLAAPTVSANTLPTSEDINSLAEKARLAVDTFMQKSFELRLRYEFTEKFLTQDDRENLHELAKKTSDDLQAIADSQKTLKQQIEDYEGNDWDDRYGSTGLWRKLVKDIYTSSISKCEIDFYLALSAPQLQRNKILQKIPAQIDSLDQTVDTVYAQFLKVRIFAVLARTDPAYKPLAKKQFDLLAERSDMKHSTAFRISIERIKLLGPTGPDELNKLAVAILQSNCADDIELVLSLASLQRRHDPEAFERTVQKLPRIEDFLSSSILSELFFHIGRGQLDLQKVSTFEAELVAQAVWKNGPGEHKTLLEHLASTQRLQTPLILYVAAVALADSSPTKGVNLLIKASTLQQSQKSNRLDIEPCSIAKQAARLAYNVFAEDHRHCQLAIKAFENYCTMAGEKIDEELEYLYTIVLNSCGRAEKCKKLLQKIADRPAGKWRHRARLELIKQAVRNIQKPHSQLLNQLTDFMADCAASNEQQLLTEAMTIYCQVFLESDDKTGAAKVLNILNKAEAADKANLSVFKSKLLWKLDRPDESVECMVKVCHPNRRQHALEAEKLLSQVIDQIEQLQQRTNDFHKLIKNSQTIAQYCKQISITTYGLIAADTARLYLAEISIFAAQKNQQELLEVDKLLNNLAIDGLGDNIDFLRCRARLLAGQAKFAEAARLWAQIAGIRKSESHSPNQRSWKWWRAKYYELYCWSKCPQTEKDSLLHTIEVLENSFTDIPPLWAEKLNSLKQGIRKSTN